MDKRFLILFCLAVSLSACYTSKKSFDNSVINHLIENQQTIKELAEFSIAFTLHKSKKTFKTDTLADKAIKRKFLSNGFGGLVTVVYKNSSPNNLFGIIDSTVTFKQTSLRGVTEIIYDFAATERKWADDKTNPDQYLFIAATNRVYYRRRPIPMM